MPDYLFVYHGGAPPESPEEQQKVMAAWQRWLGGLGEDVVDGGNPVGVSSTVSAGGVKADGGPNPASGYGIFRAKDLADACEKAKGCPIVAEGGSVELAEIFDVGG